MTLPQGIAPGTWGCSHGSGWLGAQIRDIEERTSKSQRFPAGDHEAAWAGHCFVFIGDHNGVPSIVQAQWPKAVISPASDHDDAIWATGQQLSRTQRNKGVAEVMSLVGQDYDWLSYLYFLGKLAQMRITRNLQPLFAAQARVGPICSGVVVREQQAMGVPLDKAWRAAVQDPDFIAPADCLRWGLDNGWMSGPVPAWTS